MSLSTVATVFNLLTYSAFSIKEAFQEVNVLITEEVSLIVFCTDLVLRALFFIFFIFN